MGKKLNEMKRRLEKPVKAALQKLTNLAVALDQSRDDLREKQTDIEFIAGVLQSVLAEEE